MEWNVCCNQALKCCGLIHFHDVENLVNARVLPVSLSLLVSYQQCALMVCMQDSKTNQVKHCMCGGTTLDFPPTLSPLYLR